MTDEELAQRAGQGDPAAFEELVRRYEDRLYGFLFHRVRAWAEDVYQEAWMKVWSHLPRYEARERFGAWLFTIARNAAADAAEREGRRRGVPLDAPGDEGAPIERVPGRGGPEEDAEAGDLRARIDAALAALPPEQREVFLLREYGGLSFKEIAEAQGCPLGTALARMRYALAKLRERLEGKDG